MPDALPDGYRSRPMRLDDVPAIVAFLNRESLLYGGDAEFSADEYAADLDSPGLSIEEDTRVVADGEHIAGVAELHSHSPWVRPFAWVHTDPIDVGRGIARSLLVWVENRARQRFHLAPPEARISLGVATQEHNPLAPPLLRGLGYTPIRIFYRMRISMQEPPPHPVWQQGISVRTMTPDVDDFAVYQAVDEAFADHWGHVDQPPEEGFAGWQHHVRNDPSFDPALNFLVEMDGAIVAVAMCSISREGDQPIGWIHQLGVRRPWRKRGLGRALLLHVFAAFHARGIPQVGLGVDADSLTGATRLYESVGMQVRNARAVWEKELRPGVDLARS